MEDWSGFTEHNWSQCGWLAFVKRHSLFNISSPKQTQKSVCTRERLWELAVGWGREGTAHSGRWTPGSVLSPPHMSCEQLRAHTWVSYQ